MSNQANQHHLSLWEIAWARLKRNWLAVISLIFIACLLLMAALAPLLSNNRPIAIKAMFAGLYENAYYLWQDSATLWFENASVLIQTNAISAEAKQKAQQALPRYEKALEISFREMERQLRDTSQEAVQRLKSDYAKTFRSYAQNKVLPSQEEWQKFISDNETGLAPENVKLHAYWRFPAIRALDSMEVFFASTAIFTILAFLLMVPLWFWWRKLNIVQKMRRLFIFITIPSILIAGYWFFKMDTVFDPMNYKSMARELKAGETAIFPPLRYGMNENITADAKKAPTWLLSPGERSENYHWLGTDTNGRDVLARMIWGARVSMSVGFIAVGIYATIGIIVGSIAGFFGGKIDVIISRIIEIVICFPTFFLILAVLAFLKPSILNIMVVIGFVSWTGIARLVRGEFLKLKNFEFVTAAKALGTKTSRIIFRHILPNGMTPVWVSIAFGIAGAILSESSLSFLGFGVPQPIASWGDTLSDGRTNIQGTWWLTVFPGVAIFLTLTAFNLLGEAIRDALDPKSEL